MLAPQDEERPSIRMAEHCPFGHCSGLLGKLPQPACIGQAEEGRSCCCQLANSKNIGQSTFVGRIGMGFPHSLKSTSMKGCKEGVAPGNLGNLWKSGNTTSTEDFQIHGYLATWLTGYLLTQQRNISHLRYCSTHQTIWRLSTPDLQGNCDVCVCMWL